MIGGRGSLEPAIFRCGDWQVCPMALDPDFYVIAGVRQYLSRIYVVVNSLTGEEESRWAIPMRARQQAETLAGLPCTPILPSREGS